MFIWTKWPFVIVSLFLALLLGSFLAWLAVYINFFNVPPNKIQASFVSSCGELNGKKFTYQNVQTLNGQCYVSCGDKCVTAQSCKEVDVTDYLKKLQSKELETKGYTRFDISQGGLDSTWRCALELNKDNTIKAIPYFAFD